MNIFLFLHNFMEIWFISFGNSRIWLVFLDIWELLIFNFNFSFKGSTSWFNFDISKSLASLLCITILALCNHDKVKYGWLQYYTVHHNNRSDNKRLLRQLEREAKRDYNHESFFDSILLQLPYFTISFVNHLRCLIYMLKINHSYVCIGQKHFKSDSGTKCGFSLP